MCYELLYILDYNSVDLLTLYSTLKSHILYFPKKHPLINSFDMNSTKVFLLFYTLRNDLIIELLDILSYTLLSLLITLFIITR